MTTQPAPPDSQAEVAIIGAGPRGLSVLERICANERHEPSDRRVTVHMVDPWAPGPGQVWRSDQSSRLLMNTVASQITVYTDDSVRIDGPIEPGPGLYEWASRWSPPIAVAGSAPGWSPRPKRIGPDDYPTRAFYGRYLDACFHRVVAGAPGHVKVEVHRCRAVSLVDVFGVPGGPQGVGLEDGTRLNGLDAVVLAHGARARPG